MPNFWSYIKNDRYAVGCTGQTVYVYDDSDNELARFRDMKYAYVPMFSPKFNIFIVKSTEGNLAVYSLETMRLLKKFRFSKFNAAQDDGFCFSKDGKYFYNIERHTDGVSVNACISTYETSAFGRIAPPFLSKTHEFSDIEYDDIHDRLFVLGFMREQSDVFGFAAVFNGDGLSNITTLTYEKYLYILGYRNLERMGFTQKAKKWSVLFSNGYDLEKLEHIKISDVINIL